jgi:hypothetical protein
MHVEIMNYIRQSVSYNSERAADDEAAFNDFVVNKDGMEVVPSFQNL